MNMPREMDWLEGAVIAVIALLPAIIIGVGFGIWFVVQDVPDVNFPFLVGGATAFVFGGQYIAEGFAGAGVGQLIITELSITSYTPTLTAISGLLLFAGARRALRRADPANMGSCLRSVTPTVVFFVVGTTLLTAFGSGSSWSSRDASVTVSAPLARVFFISALLAAVAVGIAVASRTRFSNPSIARPWHVLSAPSFAVLVLVFLAGSVGVVLGTAAALIAWEGDLRALLLIPAGIALFLEAAAVALVGGTLSSVGVWADATLGGLGSLDGASSASPNSVTLSVLGVIDWNLPIGVLLLVAVNVCGVLAAAAMILRRRDAAVARRDLGGWIIANAVLAVLMIIFVGIRIYFAGEGSALVATATGSGAVRAGISASVILLLPAFSAGWWFLARLLLPRLPAPTLMRLSGWARTGL